MDHGIRSHLQYGRRRLMVHGLLVGLLWLPAFTAFANSAADTAVLDSDTEAISLGLHAEVLHDASGSLQFDDILSPAISAQFAPSTADIINYGLTADAYWYRIKVRSDTSTERRREWVLVVDYPPLDSIDLFIVRDNGLQSALQAGDRRLASPELIEHRNYAFPLRVEAGETLTLYLRIQTQGSHQAPLYLYTSQAFLQKTAAENFWFGLYYGIMAVMALYNLFVFLSVRDVAYLYYILYLTTVSMLYFLLNGFGRIYLPGQWPEWINLVFVALPALFVVLFTRSFLEIHKHSTFFKHVLNALLLVAFVCLAMVAVAPYKVTLLAGTIQTAVQSIILVIIGLVLFFRGVRTARFFLLAWTVFLIGVLLKSLEVGGIIPTSFLTIYGVQIGTCFDVTLLSMALADRINAERREKLQAQAEALTAQELAKWNQTLEEKVQMQVKQLEGLNRLKNYFPPQVADLILGDSSGKLLETQRREVTVCVIDMRGFTAFAEAAEPEEVMRVLREYYTEMGEVVDRYQGTVESFAGDGMTIFFNAPIKLEHPEENAVRMAFEMQLAFEPLRQKWATDGHQLGFGIGLASGYATAGTIGFNKRWQYAAIGTVTNIAARLCAMAAHGEVLTTQRLYTNVESSTVAEAMGVKTIRGLSKPLQVIRLIKLRSTPPDTT